jgi:hypothetical protein
MDLLVLHETLEVFWCLDSLQKGFEPKFEP